MEVELYRTQQKERIVVLCLAQESSSLEPLWEPIEEASGLTMRHPPSASMLPASLQNQTTQETYGHMIISLMVFWVFFQILKDTSLQKVKRNQSCLEPCLRQLVSCLESFVVGNVNVLGQPVL